MFTSPRTDASGSHRLPDRSCGGSLPGFPSNHRDHAGTGGWAWKPVKTMCQVAFSNLAPLRSARVGVDPAAGGEGLAEVFLPDGKTLAHSCTTLF